LHARLSQGPCSSGLYSHSLFVLCRCATHSSVQGLVCTFISHRVHAPAADLHPSLSTIAVMLRTAVFKVSCVHSSLTGSMLQQQICTCHYQPLWVCYALLCLRARVYIHLSQGPCSSSRSTPPTTDLRNCAGTPVGCTPRGDGHVRVLFAV